MLSLPSEIESTEPPEVRDVEVRERNSWVVTGSTRYEPVVPQAGRWRSRVLELDLTLDAGRLRFYNGSAPLLDARELITRLSSMVDEAVRRADDEARRADRLAARLRELGIDPDKIQ